MLKLLEKNKNLILIFLPLFWLFSIKTVIPSFGYRLSEIKCFYTSYHKLRYYKDPTRELVNKFFKENKRYPKNQEEFFSYKKNINISVFNFGYVIYRNRQYITKENQILSIDKDKENNYSMKINDNIFLYFPKLEVFYKEYQEAKLAKKLKTNSYKIFMVITTIFLLFLYAYLLLKFNKDSHLRKIWDLIRGCIISFLSFHFILIFSKNFHSCYAPLRQSRFMRNMKFFTKYERLIEKYYKLGVIKDDTYKKIIEKLKEDKKKRY